MNNSGGPIQYTAFTESSSSTPYNRYVPYDVNAPPVPLSTQNAYAQPTTSFQMHQAPTYPPSGGRPAPNTTSALGNLSLSPSLARPVTMPTLIASPPYTSAPSQGTMFTHLDPNAPPTSLPNPYQQQVLEPVVLQRSLTSGSNTEDSVVDVNFSLPANSATPQGTVLAHVDPTTNNLSPLFPNPFQQQGLGPVVLQRSLTSGSNTEDSVVDVNFSLPANSATPQGTILANVDLMTNTQSISFPNPYQQQGLGPGALRRSFTSGSHPEGSIFDVNSFNSAPSQGTMFTHLDPTSNAPPTSLPNPYQQQGLGPVILQRSLTSGSNTEDSVVDVISSSSNSVL
jgi:hypothetical protein